MFPRATDMEIKEVWGYEIAIRLVVRKISLLGMYLGRGRRGSFNFLLHEDQMPWRRDIHGSCKNCSFNAQEPR
jgi:hypothetical protein